MRQILLITWHEDREINPGVPDVSYVPINDLGYHQTGWLELKAIDWPEDPLILGRSIPRAKFKIEPSQHQWIGRHLNRIPIHFLVAYGPRCFFVDAIHHRRLAEPTQVTELAQISVGTFLTRSLAENSSLFSNATLRTNNVSGIQGL